LRHDDSEMPQVKLPFTNQSVLKWALAPHDVDTFIADVWEKKALHIPHEVPLSVSVSLSLSLSLSLPLSLSPSLSLSLSRSLSLSLSLSISLAET